MNLECPEAPVPLNSPFYIERGAIEQCALSEIEKPGSLIRIKAPHKMGKHSLLLRIIERAKSCGYKTVTIAFQDAGGEIYADLDTFLKWFCTQITDGLNIPCLVDEDWDEDIGAKVSSNTYLEDYILEESDRPIVVVLNWVDRVFEYPAIAQDFLPLLRSWSEQTRQSESFEKLHLILVQSAEMDMDLDIHQSPFNVGLAVELPPFTLRQIEELISRHGLSNWSENEVSELQNLTGGKPYLLRLALYHICRSNLTSGQFLADGQLQGQIYRRHLQEMSAFIRERPHLIEALKKLSNCPEGVELDAIAACHLNQIGLVDRVANGCQISCGLYRNYWRKIVGNIFN
ncbi:MAG: AAA-like domain-containing protein [Limnospira sp.]